MLFSKRFQFPHLPPPSWHLRPDRFINHQRSIINHQSSIINHQDFPILRLRITLQILAESLPLRFPSTLSTTPLLEKLGTSPPEPLFLSLRCCSASSRRWPR